MYVDSPEEDSRQPGGRACRHRGAAALSRGRDQGAAARRRTWTRGLVRV